MIPSVKLKPYISQIRGISFKPDEIADVPFENSVPLLKANNITNDGLNNSSLIYIDSNKIRPEQFIRAGDLLLAASSGSKKVIGKSAHFSEHFAGSFGAFCKLVRPKNGLHSDYLKHFFKTHYYRSSIEKAVQGANINNLRNEHLDDLEIPFPPLDDQIRIAHLLGKVEGLIAQRKQQLQQLDDLPKSVFLEMFGDPVRNEKEWDIQPCVNAVLDISSGTSYGGEDRAFVNDDEVGVLKISAVTKGTFDPEEFKVVSPEKIKKTLRFVKSGDFLLSRANTVELVAACCVVPQDYAQLFLPDKLWVLTLNPELVEPQFFNYLIKNERYRDVIRNLASGGHDSMLNISMKKFMTLDIPCPPVDTQNQFATIVEKIDVVKARYQQSLTDMEAIYGALSQRAFKGELDLSRVPLPPIQPEEESRGNRTLTRSRRTRSCHLPARHRHAAGRV